MEAKGPGIVLAVMLLTLSVAAQTSTTLSGIVRDQSGKPVPSARLTLKNAGTQQAVQAQADADGKYSFAGLAPGQYELSVSADGFGPTTASIAVAAPAPGGAAQTFDLKLGASTGPSLSDLGFNTAETQSDPAEQARLDKRTHMLKIHQKMGLITAGPLLATIIAGAGAGGKNTSSGTRDFHAALGAVTGDLYFTTAYFAIRAPRIKGTETRGPIRVHKALAWVHGPGMILTSILGPIAFDQKSKGEKVHGIASLHGPVAIITGAAYGAALLSVSVKF